MDYLRAGFAAFKTWASIAAIKSLLPRWESDPVSVTKIPHAMTGIYQKKQVEQYRSGYPQLTALISAHDGFYVCRSFRRMRARLLLMKQDKLSTIEQQLDDIDQNETRPLFLGKFRGDRNAARTCLMSQADSCLADYDSFVERARSALAWDPASSRDVESLQNWLDGKPCVSSIELAFLEADKDLVCLGPTQDNAMKQLETWVEDKLIQFYPKFRKAASYEVSQDENVYIYSGSLIRITARALLIFLIAVLLIAPILLCTAVMSVPARKCVMVLSIIVYLLVLLTMAKSKTVELIIAGATFATVLIGFMPGGEGDSV